MIVPTSTAPVFDGSLARAFEFTLTADAAARFVKMQPGTLYTFDIGQDGAGGHLFTWGAGAVNATAVSTAPNVRTAQIFVPLQDGVLYAANAGAITP